MRFKLELMEEPYAICRLDPGAEVPAWATRGYLTSVVRTPTETTIVCADAGVPDGTKSERNFRVLKIVGSLEFEAVGILAVLTTPLADEGISIQVVSTYLTDFFFIPAHNLDRALATLERAGHEISRESR
jgi:hypothetical protein